MAVISPGHAAFKRRWAHCSGSVVPLAARPDSGPEIWTPAYTRQDHIDAWEAIAQAAINAHNSTLPGVTDEEIDTACWIDEQFLRDDEDWSKAKAERREGLRALFARHHAAELAKLAGKVEEARGRLSNTQELLRRSVLDFGPFVTPELRSVWDDAMSNTTPSPAAAESPQICNGKGECPDCAKPASADAPTPRKTMSHFLSVEDYWKDHAEDLKRETIALKALIGEIETNRNAALKALEIHEGKKAPVQGYTPGIPWDMHMEAYAAYCKKYGEQKAMIEGWCRGGFGASELDMFIPGWREEIKRRQEQSRVTLAKLKGAAV